jgi:DNA-binding NarL/FixJ family response regulator
MAGTVKPTRQQHRAPGRITIFRGDMSEALIRVVISDSDPLVRAGIRAILQLDEAIMVIAETEGGLSPEGAHELRPHVLLFSGVAGDLPRLLAGSCCPAREGAVVIMDDMDAGQCARMIGLGVRGLVHRACVPEELVTAVYAVSLGEGFIARRHATAVLAALSGCAASHTAAERATPMSAVRLTRREREVLDLLCRGMANREIGEALTVSEKTVKFHVSNILAKTGIGTRGHLMAAMAEN